MKPQMTKIQGNILILLALVLIYAVLKVGTSLAEMQATQNFSFVATQIVSTQQAVEPTRQAVQLGIGEIWEVESVPASTVTECTDSHEKLILKEESGSNGGKLVPTDDGGIETYYRYTGIFVKAGEDVRVLSFRDDYKTVQITVVHNCDGKLKVIQNDLVENKLHYTGFKVFNYCENSLVSTKDQQDNSNEILVSSGNMTLATKFWDVSNWPGGGKGPDYGAVLKVRDNNYFRTYRLPMYKESMEIYDPNGVAYELPYDKILAMYFDNQRVLILNFGRFYIEAAIVNESDVRCFE
jgi:hypothetical protein